MSQARLKSASIYSSLCKAIPGGVNSPIRAFKSMEMTPMVAKKGKGALLFDADDHEYIDYCCSWGSLILGHCRKEVIDAAHAAIDQGTSFGITTEVEALLAQEVIKLVPSIERVRFVSSGTEATMSAARLARGFTGRDLIIKFTGNYHGHADAFLIQAGSAVTGLNQTSSSKGVPDDFIKHTLCLPFNDTQAIEEVFCHPQVKNKIAAVILEPIPSNMGVIPPKEGFLERVRELCTANNSVLIFDEVITGFRVGLSGAQGLYNITPDLTCLGKIVGGGFPAAAFGGKQEIMEHLAPQGGVFQAGTLSGNPVAMHAGLATLKLIQQPNFYEDLQAKADLIVKPLKNYIKEHEITATVQQAGSLFSIFFGKLEVHSFEEVLTCDTESYKHLFKYLFKSGIYAPPSAHEAWFPSHAHTDEMILLTREKLLNFFMTYESKGSLAQAPNAFSTP